MLGLTRREAWIYIKIALDRVFYLSTHPGRKCTLHGTQLDKGRKNNPREPSPSPVSTLHRLNFTPSHKKTTTTNKKPHNTTTSPQGWEFLLMFLNILGTICLLITPIQSDEEAKKMVFQVLSATEENLTA